MLLYCVNYIIITRLLCLNCSISGHKTFTERFELVEFLMMFLSSNLVLMRFYTFLHSECSEVTDTCFQRVASFQARNI